MWRLRKSGLPENWAKLIFTLKKWLPLSLFKPIDMQLVKIKKKTNSKVEQAKVLIAIFCLLINIKLSDTELTVLAYFMVYRINRKTKDLILSSGILKTEDSLKNTMSKLKKFGMLVRNIDSKEYTLRKDLDFVVNPVVGVLIKIDNS